MPSVSTTPAMPGSVSVNPPAANTPSMSRTLITSAASAITPPPR
jgi:hypothetical protein